MLQLLKCPGYDSCHSGARTWVADEDFTSCHNFAGTRGPDEDFRYQRSTSIPKSTLDHQSALDNRPPVDIQPRTEPTWMSAITTQINALWRTVHGRSTATVPTIEKSDRNNVECIEEVRPSQRNFAEEERYVNRHDFETARIPGRKLWRLDSNTEIELDKVHDKKPKLDLDLRIPPRVRPHTARIQENPETTNQKALQPNPVQDYERRRKETSERRFEERQQRRSESTHRHPADKPNKGVMHRSGRSTERSTDMDRSKSNRQLRSSKTQQTLQTRGSYRTQEDRSPPDDDSDGEASSDNDHRRRDKDKKRYPRRKDDSLPSDDDDDGSNDGSSSDEDPSHNTEASTNQTTDV